MSTARYCMCCDDYCERQPCERCGHRSNSMTPVADSYLKDCRARLAALSRKDPS